MWPDSGDRRSTTPLARKKRDPFRRHAGPGAGLRLAVGLGAVAALALSACADGRGVVPGELRGWAMDTPVRKPDLVLTDTDGRTYDLRSETEGTLTLLFFGYTTCPDVCPVHMSNLAAVLADLRPEERSRIDVVFVTTDPERDTPERIRTWLDGFDRDFVGLHGPLETVNEALADMMLPGAAVMPGEHGGEPVVGHPSAVLAFGSDGLARVRYPFGTRQSDWAHDLPLLLASE